MHASCVQRNVRSRLSIDEQPARSLKGCRDLARSLELLRDKDDTLKELKIYLNIPIGYYIERVNRLAIVLYIYIFLEMPPRPSAGLVMQCKRKIPRLLLNPTRLKRPHGRVGVQRARVQLLQMLKTSVIGRETQGASHGREVQSGEVVALVIHRATLLVPSLEKFMTAYTRCILL